MDINNLEMSSVGEFDNEITDISEVTDSPDSSSDQNYANQTEQQSNIDISSEEQSTNPAEEFNYEQLATSDLLALKEEFPELANLNDITELDNPLRYAALRDMGLSAKEAYLATSDTRIKKDNRSHLSSFANSNAASPTSRMTMKELLFARELFDDLSDAEIYNLYKKVSN